MPNTAFLCGWHDWELGIIPVPLMLTSSEKQLLLVFILQTNSTFQFRQVSDYAKKLSNIHRSMWASLQGGLKCALWAHRNVSTRTVKYQKALINSCFPFTQSEALGWVNVLLWKFLTWCCLGLVQFIWCWNTFPFLKDRNISQKCED